MRTVVRRVGTRTLLSGVLLWSTGLGISAPAQAAGPNLLLCARNAGDSALSESERRQSARTLLRAATAEHVPLIFDAVKSIAARRDEVERRIAKLERRIAADPDDVPKFVIGRKTGAPFTEDEKEREKKDLAKKLRIEERMLAAFRSGIASIRDRLDETSFTTAADALAASEETNATVEERETFLRGLGFFPAVTVRKKLFDRTKAESREVVLAAAGALGEQARTRRMTPTDDSLWPEAFAALSAALARTWRDRDRQHQRYRDYSERHAKLLAKLGAKAHAQLMKALKGAKPKDIPRAALRSLQRYEMQRKEAAAELLELERMVEVIHASMGRTFERLGAEQREPIERPLVVSLTRSSHRTPALRAIALAGHLRSGAIHAALVRASSDRNPEGRLAVCDALARHGGPESVAPLAARLGDTFWQIRIAAIHALKRIGGKEAVDALMAVLDQVDGHVLHVVNEALHELTGADYHRNAVLWRKWWSKHRDGYRGPPARSKRSRLAASRTDEKAPVSFYGIRTRSKRIIFILDVSASMLGDIKGLDLAALLARRKPRESVRKIDQAREELDLSIVSLPEDARFNIIVYGDRVKAWKSEPVEASARNKKAARKWIARIEPEGNTNIFDALVRAFDATGAGSESRLARDAADTFYLLTDGRANRGSVIDPIELLEEVERLNRHYRVTVHTIALGADADASFMRSLAARFHGRFVHLKGKSNGE